MRLKCTSKLSGLTKIKLITMYKKYYKFNNVNKVFFGIIVIFISLYLLTSMWLIWKINKFVDLQEQQMEQKHLFQEEGVDDLKYQIPFVDSPIESTPTDSLVIYQTKPSILAMEYTNQ